MNTHPLKIHDVMDWLFKLDTEPVLIPKDPESSVLGLVVATLEPDTEPVAEVITDRSGLANLAQPEQNVLRLFFEVPVSALLRVCEGLCPEDFEEETHNA